MDYGGASQRGWVRVNITGAGCEWVQRWDAIDGVEALAEAEIKRLDVALTTWKGEVTHEAIKAAHTAGQFTCGGRPPDMQTIENSNERAGRTCYVGNRKSSDKFFRGYEKGFELAGKMGPLGATCTQINGFPLEDIYRCEVEFKDETRPIPWEVIDRRDEYFAGSYPALAQLLPGVESDILMRRPDRQPQVDLAAALANIRVQYGATLFTALTCYGGDFLRVWDQIVGSDHNPNLLAAGVLLVEHE
jgi:phage replication initiation protein